MRSAVEQLGQDDVQVTTLDNIKLKQFLAIVEQVRRCMRLYVISVSSVLVQSRDFEVIETLGFMHWSCRLQHFVRL